jgi:hypothetical protein
MLDPEPAYEITVKPIQRSIASGTVGGCDGFLRVSRDGDGYQC